MLLEKVVIGKKVTFRPFKVFCYKPLHDHFQYLMGRSGFQEKCELWRSRGDLGRGMYDVYDGNVWKNDFAEFLSTKNRFGIMLNLDWFQPFKHVNYSVGVLYAVILNLPREERFKVSNMLILGVLPHFSHEPTVETFLGPLVDELKKAWSDGLTVNTAGEDVTVKCALMCVGCDIPASRKLCGLLGHQATMGCSRCNFQFPGTLGEKSHAGFDRNSWPKKTKEYVLSSSKRYQEARTKSEASKIASETGVRFSPLMELEYFDVVRMNTVDPMHNLFLGTAKRVVTVWKEKGFIGDEALTTIEERVASIQGPPGMGRLPVGSILTSFGGLTADQWKHWVTNYSAFALRPPVLPAEAYTNWLKFVRACQIMCTTPLTPEGIEEADELLLAFCDEFEKLYGPQSITPNMHLHGHLRECMEDYGPIHAFWLFAFERYNGYLAELPANNRAVEVQFVERFLRDAAQASLPLPAEFRDEFLPLWPDAERQKPVNSEGNRIQLSAFLGAASSLSGLDWTKHSVFLQMGRQRCCLSDDDLKNLEKMYISLYMGVVRPDQLECTRVIEKSQRLKVLNQHILSASKTSICALWHAKDGHIDTNAEEGNEMHAGVVEFFLSHNLVVNGKPLHHLLAKVKWYQRAQLKGSRLFDLYVPKVYDVFGESAFIPVQRIHGTVFKAETGKHVAIWPANQFSCM
jgi:hypothetical protein